MNRPRTRGKTLIERIMTHYGCSQKQAQLRLDTGDYDLPKVGFTREQPDQRSRSRM